MIAKKQEFCNIIKTLPEELVVRDIDELREKLEEGIKDSEKGRVCSIEEAF